jgi:hypothetical protein
VALKGLGCKVVGVWFRSWLNVRTPATSTSAAAYPTALGSTALLTAARDARCAHRGSGSSRGHRASATSRRGRSEWAAVGVAVAGCAAAAAAAARFRVRRCRRALCSPLLRWRSGLVLEIGGFESGG